MSGMNIFKIFLEKIVPKKIENPKIHMKIFNPKIHMHESFDCSGVGGLGSATLLEFR